MDIGHMEITWGRQPRRLIDQVNTAPVMRPMANGARSHSAKGIYLSIGSKYASAALGFGTESSNLTCFRLAPSQGSESQSQYQVRSTGSVPPASSEARTAGCRK